jgi:phosphate transport system permease protein
MSQTLIPEYRRRRGNVKLLRFLDGATFSSAIGGALLMVGVLVLFLAVIGHGAAPAFKKFGLAFLTSTDWIAHPPHDEGAPAPPQVFGARTAIVGTLLTSAIALLIALPVSLGSAIFLTKLAPTIRVSIPSAGGTKRISLRHGVAVISFMIELLAAIPSIAYGLWGVAVLAPAMQKHIQPFIENTLGQLPFLSDYFLNSGAGSNILTAGVILSIMVTPIITAITRDVLSVSPPELEQGALGLGATWWQATRLVLGFSKMGILGAVILGFARAIGETMAVTLVIGNSQSPDNSLLAPGQSIASLLAVQFNNADTDGEISALVYMAFVLLVITTVINGIARLMIVKVASKGAKR